MSREQSQKHLNVELCQLSAQKLEEQHSFAIKNVSVDLESFCKMEIKLMFESMVKLASAMALSELVFVAFSKRWITSYYIHESCTLPPW